MSAKIQDSSYLKVAFKFSKSTPRGHRLISTVAHQVGGGSATQPPSTQNGGNDEFNEQWRKSSQLIDEGFGSDLLLRIAFLQLLSVPHPSGAESPWQNEEYIAFPSRRSVPGENSPFSARTGLITTSSRGITHLGCATREKTTIQPKIRNRRGGEQGRRTAHWTCGHKCNHPWAISGSQNPIRMPFYAHWRSWPSV
jgi:hypothetical protein